ncbi:hypothetical protein [Pseudomonas sp.]|uniref:hypothetical protein n=1 Tax=Pseudomonas sp. TaxID=306 RepID=UPI002CDB9E44|nr:hypothetical protein [Pseudomonas sp.]HUE91178.1 hypothetical protein [Pseudomonas sp.]
MTANKNAMAARGNEINVAAFSSLRSIRISAALFFSVIIIELIPQLLFVQTAATSLAFGVVVASVSVILINIRFAAVLKFNFYGFLISFFIYAFVLMGSAYGYFSTLFAKPLLTAVAILLPILACVLLSRRMASLSYESVENTFVLIFLLVLFLGWIEIVYGVKVYNYSSLKKPVFPFSEESHYALTIGPLACIAAINKKFLFKVFVLLSVFAQAAFFPNLTLLVFCLVLFFVFWGSRHIFLICAMAGGGIVAASFVFTVYSDSPTVEYFSSRLNISTESTNLTTLVFLQGWDEAWRSLVNTNGLGLGFQMLGTNPPGDIAERIFMLYGTDFNRADGGFLASKVIAELGVIGLVITFFFIGFLLNYVFKAKTLFGCSEHRYILFLSTFIFAYLVEFFLRGYGYFSPGLMLTLTFFLVLVAKKRELKHG